MSDSDHNRMLWSRQFGRHIDMVFRAICAAHGEQAKFALVSPLETVAVTRLRKQFMRLTPNQQKVLNSVDATGSIVADCRRIPNGVYRSLVIRGLIAPTGDGNYHLVTDFR